ncbi:uncharacterized protein LOC134206823 [Armigeres subalbatus]|uniref:uncharacterized protein LOC134206823 n=1 Tax=Armigeres subalbatus TaxID=124917 RepID=UPI002ED3C532
MIDFGGSFASYDILDQEKWNRIVGDKKPNSAPGVDRITYGMLKQLQPGVVQQLLKDFNGQWRRSFPGDSLKTIKVVAIPKAGKDQSKLEENNFHTNKEKLVRVVSEGLPQGDVLSPTLFNVYTAPLHEIQIDDVELVQYADDFGIIVTAKTVERLRIIGQDYLDHFVESAAKLNLSINPAKTKSILFQASNKTLDYKIDGTNIETVRSHDYLGMALDRSLNFGRHTKELKGKVNERLNMIKVISGVKTGGHPETMLNVHKALVRGTLEYGSTVYSNAAKTNLNKLAVINNQSLRKATGCTKSTPLNTLLAISGLESMPIRQEYITGKEIARNIAQRTAVGEQLIGTTIDNRSDTKKISYMETVFLNHFEVFDAIMTIRKNCVKYPDIIIRPTLDGLVKSKGNTNPKHLKQLVLFAFNGTYKGRRRVFTDASKTGHLCGVGVFIEGSNKRVSVRLANEISITGAELATIKIAMEIISKEQLTGSVIYTDSRSACELLEAARDQQEREELLDEVLTMAAEWGVSMQWIPSHIGVNGNDIADQLAKEVFNPQQEGELVRHILNM